MILRHAQACLRTAARRPLTLLLILFALCMMVPILELMLAMPLFLQLLMFASTGSLADGIVQGVLAPADRGWRSDERGPAMPTLPLSRRETVEDFRMDGIRHLQALLVVRIPTFRWEFLMLRPVEVVEGARDVVSRLELLWVQERFEEPSAHDFEAFLGAGRSPRGLHTPDDVPQSL